MHLVQFLLQIFNLLLDGLLAVELLITLLLGIARLVVDMEHFQILVEDLLHCLAARLLGVLFQEGIALFICDVEPGGHDRCDLADPCPLLCIGAGQCAPLEL